MRRPRCVRGRDLFGVNHTEFTVAFLDGGPGRTRTSKMVSFLRKRLACAGSNKTRAKSGIVARSRTGKRHAVNIVPFENTIEITALGIPEGGGAEQVIRQKEAPPCP